MSSEAHGEEAYVAEIYFEEGRGNERAKLQLLKESH